MPEEPYVHTAEMTAIKIALKEVHKKRVIYTLLDLYAVHRKKNKENLLILNWTWHPRKKLQNQGKQIIICKVPAQIRIKWNKEVDKAVKQAIYMPEMTTIRLILYRLLPYYKEG